MCQISGPFLSRWVVLFWHKCDDMYLTLSILKNLARLRIRGLYNPSMSMFLLNCLKLCHISTCGPLALFCITWRCEAVNVLLDDSDIGSESDIPVKLTCVWAEMAFERRVAREGAFAFAADVAAHAGVNLHVLLQSLLGLETLPT